MPTTPSRSRPASRLLGALTHTSVLAVLAGTLVGVGATSGCETTGSTGEARYRPYQGTPTPGPASQREVNTGLATLSVKAPPPSLIEGEPPAPTDERQAAQIAESARLLDEYFTRSSTRNSEALASARANAFDAPAGYDPSAELGPTGSSRYAPAQPIREPEPITIASADDLPPALPGSSSGLSAFAEEEDPTLDSVLAAIDEPAARTAPTPVRVDPATPAQTPAQSPAQSPAPQGGPTIVIEDAPPVRVGGQSAGLAPVRVVEAAPARETAPAASNAADPRDPARTEVAKADPAVPDPARTNPALSDPAMSAIATSTPEPRPEAGTLEGRAGEAVAQGTPTRPARTPEERKNELVDELVAVLGEIAHASDEPYRLGLALAGLETLSPGALYELTESGVLMPDEVRTLLAAHEFLTGLSAGGGVPDPGSVSDLLGSVKERLDEHAPLKITAAELCTRVMGYGQYDMFPKAPDGSYQFVAGRRQPVILYVEVDRFGRRPLVGDDGLARWEVALSQTLEIYHDADDLLVMGREAETDRSVSRNKIRDYYLINQTYLPENLSIGRYNLKVTMRDENKQAVAESIIPVSIVPATPGFGRRQ